MLGGGDYRSDSVDLFFLALHLHTFIYGILTTIYSLHLLSVIIRIYDFAGTLLCSFVGVVTIVDVGNSLLRYIAYGGKFRCYLPVVD